jgi:hypothetical protein
MNSAKVLYNKVGDDENYTPPEGVKPILPYIKSYQLKQGKPITVWCPFDDKSSEFVKQISKLPNVSVVYSHIDLGQDFFTYEPDQWDIIVSNPPFKNKRKFFERALALGKPFALIMTNTWLNDSSSKTVFTDVNAQLQLLMFNDRMKFINNQGRPNNKITFSSSYFCYNFLPKDLILGGYIYK